MPNTVKYAPDLYTRPPKSAPEGAQFDYRSIELATTDLITTQLVGMAVIPAKHRLISCALESDDLDSAGTPLITASLGILNSNYGAALNAAPALTANKDIFTSSTVAQAGGRVYPSLACSDAVGVDTTNDRIIALQLTALPGTAVGGTVGVIIGTQQD
jgi:hypothetical protein